MAKQTRKTHDAVYVCGPPEGPGLWDEPFIVSSDDGTHECEIDGCEERSAWMVEVVGWLGEGEPPYLHPVRYVCEGHIAAGIKVLSA